MLAAAAAAAADRFARTELIVSHAFNQRTRKNWLELLGLRLQLGERAPTVPRAP